MPDIKVGDKSSFGVVVFCSEGDNMTTWSRAGKTRFLSIGEKTVNFLSSPISEVKTFGPPVAMFGSIRIQSSTPNPYGSDKMT
jgi:hypothetical protein